MALGDAVERFVASLGSMLLAKPADHYIDLETADTMSDHALVTPVGSLCSVLKVDGARSITTSAWIVSAIRTTSDELRTSLSGQGHCVQVVFSYEPELAFGQALSAIAPYRNAAASMGADMDAMLVDTAKAVGRFTSSEQVYIALWTQPSLLPGGEAKIARKDRGAKVQQTPQQPGAQNISAAIGALRDRHEAFCFSVASTLESAGIDCGLVDQHTACSVMRHMVDPEATSKDWKAALPGDPLSARLDWAEGKELELLYPSLPSQLMPRSCEVINAKQIRIGDRLHHPVVMKLPPQTPRFFQALFAKLIRLPFPWRASIRLSGDGLSGMHIKHTLASILQHTSQSSKQFYRAMNDQVDAETAGQCIVRFQAEFDTWTDANAPNAQKTLIKQAERLSSAIQSWGSADTADVIGDPLLGTTCSVVGLTAGSPAPAAAAPVADAVMMLPISRPAKVWDTGLPFRSPDGKLLPIFPGSSKQAAWISIMAGPLGSGKSVTANVINLGHFLYPGLDEPPYLTILDVGPSSRGLHEMIADSLPPQKRYLTAYRRLRNVSSDAINPCDTPLGCDQLFPVQKNFLVNFISLLATPIGERQPPDGIIGLASRCVERAFQDFAHGAQPKTYAKGISPTVDRGLAVIGFEASSDISWWAVVRVLFDAGNIALASEAQKHAVPTINDIVQYANVEEIARTYRKKEHGGETIPELFWRLVTEALNLYPVLSGVTKAEVGAARSVILDLDEVAKTGSPAAERQSAVMYMLGFHVGTSHFFFQPEDLVMVPDAYKDYHQPRFEQLRAIPKRVFLDEFHRVSRNQSVNEIIGSILEMISRESRKWNIHVCLASQSIDDYEDFYLDIATSYYILGATLASAQRISNRLQLPEGTAEVISRLRSPNKRGNELFSVVYTKDSQPVVNKLTQTLGPELVTGLESNAWTATVRRSLSDRIGASAARQLLAQHYPNGVVEELERRGVDVTSGGSSESASESHVEVLTKELLDIYEQSRTT